MTACTSGRPSRLEQAVRDYLREQGVPLPGREGLIQP